VSKLKVFLVEDTAQLQDGLHALICERANVELVSQCDTETGTLQGIAETHPDLVVLDLNLTNGNGMGVLWKTKQAHPEIKVMVLTNMGDLHYRKKCHRMGADYFFDKTVDFGAFYRTLQNLAGEAATA
jgi:DNA-binding NarL/FixJ family response regulator